MPVTRNAASIALAAVLVLSLLAALAWAADHAFRLYGRATRWLWATSLGGALALPILAFLRAPVPRAAGVEVGSTLTLLPALLLIGAGAGAARAFAQSADDILARVDANESYGSIRYTGRMEITIGGETRYKTMSAIAQGSTRAFAEFTNPEDKGTKYLKVDARLYVYSPDTEEVMLISGHLLKESMMGSDGSASLSRQLV